MRRLVFAAAAILAVLMLGSAGAYFTGQAQVPENMVRAGSLSISTEPTSAALSVEGIAPGTTVHRQVTVVNDGTLPITAVATAVKKAGITEFWEALTCRVTRGGDVLHEGKLAATRTETMTLAPGARAELDFAISLPADSGNQYASDYAKFTLYVDAEQVH